MDAIHLNWSTYCACRAEFNTRYRRDKLIMFFYTLSCYFNKEYNRSVPRQNKKKYFISCIIIDQPHPRKPLFREQLPWGAYHLTENFGNSNRKLRSTFWGGPFIPAGTNQTECCLPLTGSFSVPDSRYTNSPFFWIQTVTDVAFLR